MGAQERKKMGYLKDSYKELVEKVSWPSFSSLWSSTIVVMVASLIFALVVAAMDITFDLAFIDGDKRKYVEYYEQVLKMLSSGGYIIADNTLWDGHVLEEPHHTDMQTIGIKKFNDLIARDERVEKVILPLRDGLTIIRKK
jgi:preprotein translocase SecE subunit